MTDGPVPGVDLIHDLLDRWVVAAAGHVRDLRGQQLGEEPGQGRHCLSFVFITVTLLMTSSWELQGGSLERPTDHGELWCRLDITGPRWPARGPRGHSGRMGPPSAFIWRGCLSR
jgi:hypothetical protein